MSSKSSNNNNDLFSNMNVNKTTSTIKKDDLLNTNERFTIK